MVRKRVPLQLIPKDTARRRTYRSRKNNLMKKAQEFRTLCGVSTCVIIYDPEDPAKKPETYPKERNEVIQVIEKYVNTGGKRKMLGLPKFFEDRKKKVDAELKKVREENLKAKYPLPRDLIESLSRDQLSSLCHELTIKIGQAKNQLEGINGISSMSDSHNLGVRSNMMESPSSWSLLGFDSYMNQLGGSVAWNASNKGNSYTNFVDLGSTQNFYDIPPIQCQYPTQDQYDVSSVGNPNGIIETDYTRSGTFCNPPLFQYKAHTNMFMQPTQGPLMQYSGPTSFSDLPPLPSARMEWVAEQPGSSHNFEQYNDGVYGNADVASSCPPLLALPPSKTEWQNPSGSADTSFYNQYCYRV